MLRLTSTDIVTSIKVMAIIFDMFKLTSVAVDNKTHNLDEIYSITIGNLVIITHLANDFSVILFLSLILSDRCTKVNKITESVIESDSQENEWVAKKKVHLLIDNLD